MTIQANDSIPADEFSLAASIARSEAKNIRFEKMSPARQRVAIAKDVLLWLKLGRFTAERGIYISLRHPGRNDWTDGAGTEVLDGFNCSVCALGAVFMAAVECVPSQLTKGQGIACHDSDDYRTSLRPYFSREQLELIETAFESFPPEAFSGGNKAASVFCDRSEPDDKRMERIMKNIIANKGTFIP